MDVDATMTTIEKVKEFINSKRPGRWIPLDLYYKDEGPLEDDCTLWDCRIQAGAKLFAFPHGGGGTIVKFVSVRGGSRGEVDGTDSIEAIAWLAEKWAGIPEDQQQILIFDKRRKGFDFFADEAMPIKCSCGLMHEPPVIPARPPQDMRHSAHVVCDNCFLPQNLGRLLHSLEGLEDSSES